MRHTLVELASRRYAVPHECPCCGAVPDSELRVPRASRLRPSIGTSASFVDLPYCRRCIEHVKLHEAAGVYTAAIVIVGLLATIVTAIVSGFPVALAPVIVALFAAFFLSTRRRRAAQLACGPSCSNPGAALIFLGWDGTTTGFYFDSPTYAARVAEANPDLVHRPSPALRQLLEHHRAARLAVPTPAAAIDLSSKPPTTADWITMLEAAGGPARRRTVLTRALAALADENERAQLVAAAVKADLGDFHAKLARTASRDAQARLLADEIARVTADNLPAPVQEAALRDLEARQRQL